MREVEREEERILRGSVLVQCTFYPGRVEVGGEGARKNKEGQCTMYLLPWLSLGRRRGSEKEYGGAVYNVPSTLVELREDERERERIRRGSVQCTFYPGRVEVGGEGARMNKEGQCTMYLLPWLS